MTRKVPTLAPSRQAVAGPWGPLRLGVLTAQPLADHAALHRRLAETPGLQLTVFCTHSPAEEEPGWWVTTGALIRWEVQPGDRYEQVWLQTVGEFQELVLAAQAAMPARGSGGPSAVSGRSPVPVFDAVLLHGWRARRDYAALQACRAIGVPVVIRGDSQLRDEPAPLKLIQRAVYYRALRHVAACLAVGQRSAEYFRYYGARRVLLSPHFVDNAAYSQRARAARPRRPAIRERWGISRSALGVLFVGPLVPDQRPLDVLEAIRGMVGVHAIFVGEGAQREVCTRRSQEMGIPATFTGTLSQAATTDAFVAADVLVLPTARDEPWGMVVNQAMASRLATVVSEAAGCVPDLIVEGVTGFSYPAGDVGVLRRRLAYLMAHPADLDRMKRAAAARVGAYSADAAAAGVLAAVTAAIGTSSWP